MTIKNLLKKLIQYVIHLGRPKTTKLQKTITIDLKPSKSKKKTPSLNKIQSTSSDVQIKQVERKQQQKTITSFTEKIPKPVTEFPPTIITVGSECIPEHPGDWSDRPVP